MPTNQHEFELIIGNRNYSSWSLRAWLAAKRSQIPFTVNVLPLETEEFEAARFAGLLPSGKVPVLRHNDGAVWDSLAIIEYLAELAGPALFWPADRDARALARSICCEMHSSFHALRSECSMILNRRYECFELSSEARADVVRIEEIWAECRNRHMSDGDYLFGGFGATDIMFAPMVTRLITYNIRMSQMSLSYVEMISTHPWIVEWADEAMREAWTITRVHPVGGAQLKLGAHANA